MPLHRAPNQFTPSATGGPATPTCGGCCCCCCGGTTLAAGIALPVILHQLAPKDSDHPSEGTPPADAAPVVEQEPPVTHTVSRGRRLLGILIACLAIPAGVGAGIGLQVLDAASGWMLGLLLIVGIGIAAYLISGVRLATSVLVPTATVGIGAVLFIGEVFVWAAVLFADGSPSITRIVGGLLIVAIPVITTTIILAATRRRRSQVDTHP